MTIAFNLSEFESDLAAKRIDPERAENLAAEFRDQSEELLERAASIVANNAGAPGPESKDGRRIARLEADSAAALRNAVSIEEVLRRPQGRKTTYAPGITTPWGVNAPSENRPTRGVKGAEARWERLFANRADAFTVSGARNASGSYLRAVLTGKTLDGFAFSNTATSDVGADGGYAVPDPLIAQIWDSAIASGNFVSRATVYPMSSGTLGVSTPNWENRSSGVLAGLLGVWLSEAETAAEDLTQFRRVTLHAHRVGIFSQISSELAEDAVSIEADIQTAMQTATAYTVDHACLFGTGVRQPLGVLNSPALVTVAAEGSQTADTLTALNIAKMVGRMDPASITKAEWFANPTLLPELFRLNFGARTDAGAAIADTAVSAPLFQSFGDGRFSLFGRPLNLVELMPAKGDLGDLLFADWSRYAIGVRRGARIERSNAPGWMKDSVDYRITMRVAGQPMNSAPITPQRGDTFSPFVALAAR